MRAIYLDTELQPNMTIDLDGEKAHHLINVLRIKKDENILLLNGKGIKLESEVLEINKKKVLIRTKSELISIEKKYQIDLAIGKLKKEAMDSTVRSSCELGISRLIILESKFSQRYPLNLNRLEKLLISGLEQSNFGFIPEIIENKINDISFDEYDYVITFSTEIDLNDLPSSIDPSKRILIIIGPEAGFHEDELALFDKEEKIIKVNLSTPIMRAPTAFNCAVGYVLSRFNW